MRKTTFDNRREAIKNDRVFSFEQIEDVLDLIANKKWPDGSYGDDECVLWSMIREKLSIEYWQEGAGMKFYFHCPVCDHDCSTHADIESLEDALNCTITCICGHDILITDVEADSCQVFCKSLNYNAYISS